jgi:hypothetical protein
MRLRFACFGRRYIGFMTIRVLQPNTRSTSGTKPASHSGGCGTNIRTVPLLLGHESLEATLIYTHVARQGGTSVTSPLDLLDEVAAEELVAAAAAPGPAQESAHPCELN